MKDVIEYLIWAWQGKALDSDALSRLNPQPDSTLKCINQLTDGRFVCDVAFAVTDLCDISQLVAAARVVNLRIETFHTVSSLGVVRFYFKPLIPFPHGTDQS